MTLTAENKKKFRSIGHGLKPIVTIAGNGLTENVLAELSRALDDHELIKIKLAIEDRELRKELTAELCLSCKAELVQTIGKTALIYKIAKKPKLAMSNARISH
jgi:RNA-binding protein